MVIGHGLLDGLTGERRGHGDKEPADGQPPVAFHHGLDLGKQGIGNIGIERGELDGQINALAPGVDFRQAIAEIHVKPDLGMSAPADQAAVLPEKPGGGEIPDNAAQGIAGILQPHDPGQFQAPRVLHQ